MYEDMDNDRRQLGGSFERKVVFECLGEKRLVWKCRREGGGEGEFKKLICSRLLAKRVVAFTCDGESSVGGLFLLFICASESPQVTSFGVDVTSGRRRVDIILLSIKESA